MEDPLVGCFWEHLTHIVACLPVRLGAGRTNGRCWSGRTACASTLACKAWRLTRRKARRCVTVQLVGPAVYGEVGAAVLLRDGDLQRRWRDVLVLDHAHRGCSTMVLYGGCACRIGRLGEQLLEVEPGNAVGVAGCAPVARSVPLVAPVGLFGEAQWHDVLSLVWCW